MKSIVCLWVSFSFVTFVIFSSPFSTIRSTPEFLSKKYLNFGQGLEFLKFGQGNRGPNQQNRRKTEEKIRKNEGNQRNFDKKIRDRDPYFLFKTFLFNIFSVLLFVPTALSATHVFLQSSTVGLSHTWPACAYAGDQWSAAHSAIFTE